MNTFDTGDQLIDRGKSALYLYYLVKASLRESERQFEHRKMNAAVSQLKKIDTQHLHEHIEELHDHLDEALIREKQIQTHQRKEEGLHHTFKQKAATLAHKLERYVKTQHTRQKRIVHLEQKINKSFHAKKEHVAQLRSDVEKLQSLYSSLEKTNHQGKLELLAPRISNLKKKIALLR